jgi:hypothetical protein
MSVCDSTMHEVGSQVGYRGRGLDSVFGGKKGRFGG